MNVNRRRLFAGLAGAAALSLTATACASGDDSDGGDGDGGGGTIGISMPTQTSERWIFDGENLEKSFQEAGYETELTFAEDAADQDIKVFAYDRLIRDTENVDYYSTFDNFQVGVLQAQYIETALDLPNEDGPFNIELFAGSLDDNNTAFFFDGAISVLQPYIDEGVLVVQSGQTELQQVATERWDGATAQNRMQDILSANYSDDTRVDAVLSPYDGISRGIISALEGADYSLDELPVVTGQDAEVESVKYIIDGRQAQTVYKDTRALAETTVQMVDAVLSGDEPEVNDTETYDNGVKVVPSNLLIPVSVDIENYQAELVDSGYIDEADLQ